MHLRHILNFEHAPAGTSLDEATSIGFRFIFSDGSDVYLYLSKDGIRCCGCGLGHDDPFPDARSALEHLHEHRRNDHEVPDKAIEVDQGRLHDTAITVGRTPTHSSVIWRDKPKGC